MYSRKACCSWSEACCFAITASKRELWASKRDFTSAISGEQPHVVDVGGHGGQGGYGTAAAPMPSIRQEATRHLSSTVPLNLRGATFLEWLPAWDMRGESRSAEHDRRVAASNIGPEGGVGRRPSYYERACCRGAEAGGHEPWCGVARNGAKGAGCAEGWCRRGARAGVRRKVGATGAQRAVGRRLVVGPSARPGARIGYATQV